jgi:transposase
VSCVSEIAPRLPTDIEALQALVSAAYAERDTAIAERDQAQSQIDRLRHLLRQLQRAQFGRRSEKLDPEQLLLALEILSKPLRRTRPPMTRRKPWPQERAPKTAASTAARFPLICRA